MEHEEEHAMRGHHPSDAAFILLAAVAVAVGCATAVGEPTAGGAAGVVDRLGLSKGLCLVLGLPEGGAGRVVELARAGELTIYLQAADAAEVAATRKAAEAAGMLGSRIFVDLGAWRRIQLAGNLVDAALVAASARGEGGVARGELLRVLRPGGKAVLGERTITKPTPEGTDAWTHPYHGPDNNPQSADRLARAPYLTQFLARPMFSSQPEVTVAAGGRVFKAFGHMAFRRYQNKMINTLIAMSAYNGTLLWRRLLRPGFMIHRNTMIATADTLYLADDESCKMIDAATGRVVGQITPPKEVAGGTVWKWMALADGVLYALMGGPEVHAARTPGTRTGVGGWPWGMWPGYDYRDSGTAWAFGRNFLAIDLKTKKVLWHHREDADVDGRAVCMRGGRIYFYCRGKRLGCLDAAKGRIMWTSAEPKLLEAIGPDTRAQRAYYGFTTSAYMKCNEKVILFAGPQRARLVAVSTADGKLLWQQEDGNCQLVLRQEGLYAMSPRSSRLIEYTTGRTLRRLSGRQACTRATGSIDSVFVRGRGTIRWDVASGKLEHLAPMRPACHDGVVVSDGLLYWGPWICGCNLSLFGVVCLGPAGDFPFGAQADERNQLVRYERAGAAVGRVQVRAGDWATYRADNRRSGTTQVDLPDQVALRWTFTPRAANGPTAPVSAGGLVLVGGSDGVVRAVDAATGQLRWKAYTGGAVYYPPAVWNGLACVGSLDGRVYALDAATGERLWRFRVAPVERRIPLYGVLASTWPVAGGVLLDGGVLYAAGGLAHYDGTQVYALDAVTGRIKWHNNSAGTVDPRVKNGVSVNGPLWLEDRTLCFQGGNVYPKAQFDTATGKCLNRPAGGPTASRRVIFYPRDICEPVSAARLATASGTVHLLRNRISLYPPGAAPPAPAPRWRRPPARPSKPPLWTKSPFVSYRGMVRAGEAILAVGLRRDAEGQPAFGLAALRVKDGTTIWRQPLPAEPVTWPLAIDADGRIFVALRDGRVLCFARPQGPANPPES
jgi:outer membrane protein assembly factor BamB